MGLPKTALAFFGGGLSFREGPEGRFRLGTACAYLAAAFETNDAAYIAKALGTAARARGMAGIAREAGLSRESLYRSLSATGHPELETVVKVLGAMGLRLSVAA